MTNFDATRMPLRDILEKVVKGRIQLPEFQRGWVWDDDHIKDLLVSVARSFPIGSIMLLQTGGEVRFKPRPVEGVKLEPGREPDFLILDGQQRLTALTQALRLESPVITYNSKRKRIKRHYYFDIEVALKGDEFLDNSIVSVDESKIIKEDFGRKVVIDLSSIYKECKNFFFPCTQVLNSDKWEEVLHEVAPERYKEYMEFRKTVLNSFRHYEIPVIILNKEITKEAVCLIFEKVNTGGVTLNVFELVTASFAAENYDLRADWNARKERLKEKSHLLEDVDPTDFLQAVSLVHTYTKRKQAIAAGQSGKQLPAVSAKRADLLNLPLRAWREHADDVEKGFIQVAYFLKDQGFYNKRELPYRTQLIPLAAVISQIGERWREPRIREKLARWFWCGVLGELYGGAVETRIANDHEDLMAWIIGKDEEPRTIRDASFQQERFETLRTRNSAAYKGISILVLREGARDWFWKDRMLDLDIDEVALDIHHIFPRAWCDAKGILPGLRDCILNKTVLSARTNRMIGGAAPSNYIRKIQNHPQVRLSDEEMDEILETHALSASAMRADNFDAFIEERQRRLGALVEKAMGKPVFSEQETRTRLMHANND